MCCVFWDWARVLIHIIMCPKHTIWVSLMSWKCYWTGRVTYKGVLGAETFFFSPSSYAAFLFALIMIKFKMIFNLMTRPCPWQKFWPIQPQVVQILCYVLTGPCTCHLVMQVLCRRGYGAAAICGSFILQSVGGSGHQVSSGQRPRVPAQWFCTIVSHRLSAICIIA